MRAVVVGCGAVGGRAARQLLSLPGLVFDEIALYDTEAGAAERYTSVMGAPTIALPIGADWLAAAADVVLLVSPPGHAESARRALQAGAHVVSVSDSVDDVEELRGLDSVARAARRHLVVGAGFAPGLSDVLASHAAAEFDEVDELHVAKVGTAGPACARQHHHALANSGLDWRDGEWVRDPGGSGRELCFFPDPIGGADCYRAAMPDALLLHAVFPSARRITARVSATRRDRMTARLPMMRKPHAEAGPGAVRVEVRGRKDGIASVSVLGAMDRPSVATGAVAALAAHAALTGGLREPGAAGLGASLVATAPFLAQLSQRGVKAARFEGTSPIR